MAATLFKRGQTFAYAGQVKNNGAVMDFTGWSVSSQIRTNDSLRLVQVMSAAFTDAATGLVKLSAAAVDTAKWPIQTLLMDIRLEDPAGQVVISDTIEIAVVERITNV